ncbi:MAG: hypothetical protein SGILL_000719 [Bacillariaceae sp.]
MCCRTFCTTQQLELDNSLLIRRWARMNRLLFRSSRRLVSNICGIQNNHRIRQNISHSSWRIHHAERQPTPFLPQTRISPLRLFLSSAISDDEYAGEVVVGSNGGIQNGSVEDAKSCSTDAVDGAISTAATTSPTDEESDPFHHFLDELAQEINGNVREILTIQQKLKEADSLSTCNGDADDSDTPRRKTVQDRWKEVFEREQQVMKRRLRKRNHSSFKRIPVEDLWEDALGSFPENGVLGVAAAPNGGASGLQDEASTIDTDAASSPIFGLTIDNQILLDDLDSFLVNETETEMEGLEISDIIVDEDEIDSAASLQMPVINIVKNERKQEQQYHDAILRSISLLSILGPEDWRRIQTKGELVNLDDEVTVQNDASEDDQETDTVSSFLDGLTREENTFSTLHANLIIAQLVSSVDTDSETIVEQCLQIYNEMKLMEDSGQSQCTPDATTYRIIMLAFNKRFMAPGEAIELSQAMMKSSTIEMTAQVFLEGMRACHSKMDLKSARAMMDVVFDEKRVKLSIGSYMLFIEMLKAYDLRQEALDFFDRLYNSGLVSRESEDKLLMSICRWPRTNRQGNFVDLSSFLVEILGILQKMEENKPGIPLWITLVNNMNVCARKDPSVWNDIVSAMKTILGLYPQSQLGQKLATIGLSASMHGKDPKLAASILERISRSQPVFRPSQEGGSMDNSDAALIPLTVVKAALELCLQLSDATSAESVMDSLQELSDQYPDGATRELHSLLLLCHARAGEPSKALDDLQSMIDADMQPGEDLYGAVLHSLVLAGRQDEAESLVQSMESGENGLDVLPGTSSFDALLMGRIRSHDWDGAVGIYDTMVEKSVPLGSRTVQGLVLAHQQLGGEGSVVSAIESMLQKDNVIIGEGVFRLLSKILFKDMDSVSLGTFRQQIRTLGEEDPTLRDSSLGLVRSLRVAEIETQRPSSKHKTVEEMQTIRDQAWMDATTHLLEFFRVASEDKN